MYEYLKKAIFYLLLLLNFLLPLAMISNSFDGDLGWHLRFGQELYTSSFPYTDTYTYSKYGMNWTNHEWGGDWLIWWIYSRLGYFWLDIITAASIFLSFIIIGKTFSKKITSTYLIIALICQSTVIHIFVARLAMFTPLFFSLTVWLIEKAKSNFRWLYLLPPLFWLWSILHGSWILGFIVLNIYLVGALISILLPIKYKTKMFPDKLDDISCHSEPPLREDKIHEESLNPTKRDPSLTLRMTMIIIIIQIIAALLIAINPYGWKIWTEIWEYFGQNYYKMHISEWVPSYVFPIFWKILIIQTIALVMVFYSFYKKKINFTHTILFCAFYYAAFMYKRQAIFVGLLAVPIFEKTIAIIAQEFSLKKIPTALGCHPECSKGSLLPKFITILFCATLILLSGYYIHAVHFTNDVWNDVILAKRNSFPYQAITFLKNTTNQPIKIFNEFSWGGYLNWTLPNALVYFDGRGTATWMYDKNKTMLEHYFEILDNQNGLKEIEKDNADYIFLKKPNFTRMAEPDTINNWFFDTNKILKVETTQLEKDINISTVWKKVYSDKFVNIWQNINRAPR